MKDTSGFNTITCKLKQTVKDKRTTILLRIYEMISEKLCCNCKTHTIKKLEVFLDLSKTIEIESPAMS